jgi:fibronectin-binding autotransporter adhesin
LQFATGQVNPIVNNSANLQTFSNDVRQFWFGGTNKTWTASTGNLSFGNVDLRADAGTTANTSLTIDGANDTLISGNISLVSWTTGGASLIKAGAGRLTLGGNSAFDAVSVNSGTLRLTGGTLTTTKQVGTTGLGIRLTGGTLEVAGGNISVGTRGLGTFSGDTGSVNVTAGNVGIAGDLIVGWNSASTFTLSGGTTSAANIRHQDSGNGVLTISGTNTTTAGNVLHTTNNTAGTDSFTVNLNTGGTLAANSLFMTLGTNAQASGTHLLNVNFDGGTLKARSTANLIAATPVAGASTRAVNVLVSTGGAKFDTNSFTATILQPILHNASGPATDGGLTLNDTAVTKGTLILTGTSTYNGATTVTAGTLRAGAAAGGQAFGNLSAVTTANVATAILDLNGFSQTIGSLAGGGVNGGNVTLGANATLTAGGDNTSTSYAGVISGTGTSGLTKTGNGVLTLSGTNDYTGATNVNNGTLLINGSTSSTSIVTVATGATLGGSGGTVGGATTVNGTLASGSSVGTLNFSNTLALAATSTYLFELNNTTDVADLTNVTGTISIASIASGATLNLEQLGTYAVGDKFTLFAYLTGNLTGTFSSLLNGAEFTYAGGVWKINYSDTSGGINGGTGTSFVTISAIPEPSAALLGALGLLALLRRRRH